MWHQVNEQKAGSREMLENLQEPGAAVAERPGAGAPLAHGLRGWHLLQPPWLTQHVLVYESGGKFRSPGWQQAPPASHQAQWWMQEHHRVQANEFCTMHVLCQGSALTDQHQASLGTALQTHPPRLLLSNVGSVFSPKGSIVISTVT